MGLAYCLEMGLTLGGSWRVLRGVRKKAQEGESELLINSRVFLGRISVALNLGIHKRKLQCAVCLKKFFFIEYIVRCRKVMKITY